MRATWEPVKVFSDPSARTTLMPAAAVSTVGEAVSTSVLPHS